MPLSSRCCIRLAHNFDRPARSHAITFMWRNYSLRQTLGSWPNACMSRNIPKHPFATATTFFGCALLLNAQSGTNAPASQTPALIRPAKVSAVACKRMVQDSSVTSSGCIIGLDDAVTLTAKLVRQMADRLVPNDSEEREVMSKTPTTQEIEASLVRGEELLTKARQSLKSRDNMAALPFLNHLRQNLRFASSGG